jgi:hypothetical protein
MKKLFLLAATAATILSAGCSQDEGVQLLVENQPQSIEFRGVVDKSTKATTVAQTSDLTNFFVQAGQHGTGVAPANLNFMSAAVYNEASTWKYAPTKYFPANGDEVDFFAYAPIKDVNMTTDLAISGSTAAFGYTVPVAQNANNTAVDLLVASVTNATSGPVAFTFAHALSAVTFSAANCEDTDSELIYTISSITLKERDNVGTYTYGTGWSDNAATDVDYLAGLPASGVALVPVSSTGSVAKLLSENDVMMVLPQAADAGEIEVIFSLKDGAGNDLFTDESRTLTLPSPFSFEAGKMYDFQFEFSALGKVTFTATVTGWTSATQAL